MLNRPHVLRLGAMGAAFSLPAIAGWRSVVAQDAALSFDASLFTELTAEIETADGTKSVVYRFYKAVPYVANPVDVTYQCLNLSVPVSIDGIAVDASDAPILLANQVGGYMSSSVADADGIDASGPTGMPSPGLVRPDEAVPPDSNGTPEVQSGGNAMLNRGARVSNAKLALAAGYVVVEPGARGRSLVDNVGIYYGVAPAAIVDLKAAVRYLRFNAGRIPGDPERIVSSGTSAGGALSALLGASGGSDLYDAALVELGAAEASDAIFATGAWCPITDLEHADRAYEWNWGDLPLQSGEKVDATISAELASAFPAYQAALGLQGAGQFGPLTAANYGEYLMQTYLQPAAQHYLAAQSGLDRATYLAEHPEIQWQDGQASFTWDGFVQHVGARRKSAPAFDALDLSAGENNLFGVGQTRARHFTPFSLREATGDPVAEIDADLPDKLVQMNPMPFLLSSNPGRSRHWWIRVGTSDTDTALTVVGNLAAAAGELGDEVNAVMYWDAGHGANEDPHAFISWIGDITGHIPRPHQVGARQPA